MEPADNESDVIEEIERPARTFLAFIRKLAAKVATGSVGKHALAAAAEENRLLERVVLEAMVAHQVEIYTLAANGAEYTFRRASVERLSWERRSAAESGYAPVEHAPRTERLAGSRRHRGRK